LATETEKITPTDLHTGLTTAQVKERNQQGQRNIAPKPLTRSIGQILRENIVTLFNIINIVLGILIVSTGSYKNLLFLLVVVVNTVIGTFQEIRAKRQVDKVSLLAQHPTTVFRDGQAQPIDQEAIVRDDLIQLTRGDAVPVDGIVRATAGIEVDESQITGESRPIRKNTGDSITSGSYLVSGNATVQVTAVGSASFVHKLAREAKQEKKNNNSQLLNTINQIIRFITYALVPLGLLLFLRSWQHGRTLNYSILRTSAAMVGMIPEGLVLLTSVALAVGAMNLGKRRVLVRSLTAIEALARVDILCLDKTGTITTGKLSVTQLKAFAGQTTDQVRAWLTNAVYTIGDDNQTATALKQYLTKPQQLPAASRVTPFSSSRKWSGAAFADGSVLLGAPEFMFKSLPADISQEITTAAKNGFRIIAVAHSNIVMTDDEIPADLQLVGLVYIADELRKEAVGTFDYLRAQGVTIKVISGDNPLTVANVAGRAGIPHADAAIDMSTVGEQADFDDLVARYTVFGRVTPTQKRSLVQAYQRADHTVGMTGDGVNDILALRESNCAIVMAGGSEAAQEIADFVLLDADFDAMIFVLNEGRRVINNIERVASLFLVKTIYSIALSLISVIFSLEYPFIPIQLTPISALTVGIPTFFLALQPDYRPIARKFYENVMITAAPGALSVVFYALLMSWMRGLLGLNMDTTGTLTVLLTGLVGFTALAAVSQPFDRLKILLISVLVAAFACIFLFPVGQSFFSLVSIWDTGSLLLWIPLAVSVPLLFIILRNVLSDYVLPKIAWR
jgi:cation-transporting ATPase E